jgi:hypothetical protein
MSEPVLVVHGVANHDADRFKQSIEGLQARFGNRHRLIDVFWGDLGGIATGLKDSLPALFPQATDIMRAGDEESQFHALLLAERRSLMSEDITRAGDEAVADAIYQAATGRRTGGGADQTRADDDLHQALVEAIPDTRYLRHLHNEPLRQAVGELIADLLRSNNPDDTFSGSDAFGRDSTGGISTRGWAEDTKEAVKRFVAKLDTLIGTVVSNVAGSANQWLRVALAQPISLTFGDVVAYHQRRGEIHQRIFETLDRKAEGWGSLEQPITVIAHSLGGLACFDAALGSDVLQGGSRRKLHIKRFVTIGSQPAFFHVLAPREGIETYAPGKPVEVPSSIGEWINLWHPMDVLAFLTAPVFRLTGGRAPKDVRIDTPMSEIMYDNGWMHSAYWQSESLIEAMQ